MKILKGIKKNIKENYDQKIRDEKKDQIKTKEDVAIVEAFELYMLKKFLNINMSPLTSNILSFWEKDFDKAIDKHFDFLKKLNDGGEYYGNSRDTRTFPSLV